MDAQSQRDPHIMTNIIARVFKIKVQTFIKILKEDKTFGDIDSCMFFCHYFRSSCHCYDFTISLQYKFVQKYWC